VCVLGSVLVSGVGVCLHVCGGCGVQVWIWCVVGVAVVKVCKLTCVG
jgi:hypothetical protein